MILLRRRIWGGELEMWTVVKCYVVLGGRGETDAAQVWYREVAVTGDSCMLSLLRWYYSGAIIDRNACSYCIPHTRGCLSSGHRLGCCRGAFRTAAC